MIKVFDNDAALKKALRVLKSNDAFAVVRAHFERRYQEQATICAYAQTAPEWHMGRLSVLHEIVNSIEPASET